MSKPCSGITIKESITIRAISELTEGNDSCRVLYSHQSGDTAAVRADSTAHGLKGKRAQPSCAGMFSLVHPKQCRTENCKYINSMQKGGNEIHLLYPRGGNRSPVSSLP